MEVNYVGVIASAVTTFVMGGLWYSPLLFGKAWQREAGLSDEDVASGNKAFIFGGAFVFALISAFVFAMFLGPHPGVAFAAGAGFAAGLFWVAASFGINYSVRTQEPRALRDQWRVSHAAVHVVRIDPGPLGLTGISRLRVRRGSRCPAPHGQGPRAPSASLRRSCAPIRPDVGQVAPACGAAEIRRAWRSIFCGSRSYSAPGTRQPPHSASPVMTTG